MMRDVKNQSERIVTPWDKWICDRIDFGLDACFAFADFLRFIVSRKQQVLLEALVSGCGEYVGDPATLLRFRLRDGWHVSYDVDTGKVRCVLDNTEWACQELPLDAKADLAEMLRQIWQANHT